MHVSERYGCARLSNASDSPFADNLHSCINHAQFVKRDAILEIERAVQQRWERERVFEVDAPQVVL